MVDYQTSDDYFDPASQDTDSQTKSLAEVMRVAIDQALRDVHVWMPAQVTAVRDNSTVDVQPCLNELFRSQGSKPFPVLQNVRVEHPRGADFWVKLPIAVGDYGRVCFADKSLDSWLVSGGVVDPADPRIHDLADAAFVPGFYPNGSTLPGAAADMVLHNGKAEVYLQKAGTFKVTNGSQELINLINQLLTVLTTNTFTNTLLGPQPFIQATVQALQQIQTNLQTLKGT